MSYIEFWRTEPNKSELILLIRKHKRCGAINLSRAVVERLLGAWGTLYTFDYKTEHDREKGIEMCKARGQRLLRLLNELPGEFPNAEFAITRLVSYRSSHNSDFIDQGGDLCGKCGVLINMPR